VDLLGGMVVAPGTVDQLQSDEVREDCNSTPQWSHQNVDAKKFQHRIGHVPIREKVEYGPDLCMWGMLSPRLDSKCGRSLRG
jgi:hypothetical protein